MTVSPFPKPPKRRGVPAGTFAVDLSPRVLWLLIESKALRADDEREAEKHLRHLLALGDPNAMTRPLRDLVAEQRWAPAEGERAALKGIAAYLGTEVAD